MLAEGEQAQDNRGKQARSGDNGGGPRGGEVSVTEAPPRSGRCVGRRRWGSDCDAGGARVPGAAAAAAARQAPAGCRGAAARQLRAGQGPPPGSAASSAKVSAAAEAPRPCRSLPAVLRCRGVGVGMETGTGLMPWWGELGVPLGLGLGSLCRLQNGTCPPVSLALRFA